MIKRLMIILAGCALLLTACNTYRPSPSNGGATTKPSPVDNSSLFGNQWHLVSAKVPNIDHDIKPTGQAPTLTFNTDFTVSGFGGCNQFRGNFSATGTSIRCSPMATTKKMCDENAMGIEAAVMHALSNADGFKIENGQLKLHKSGKVLAVYSR